MLASIAHPTHRPLMPVAGAAPDLSATADSVRPVGVHTSDLSETTVAPAEPALTDELSDADLEHVVGGLARSLIPPILIRGDSDVADL